MLVVIMGVAWFLAVGRRVGGRGSPPIADPLNCARVLVNTVREARRLRAWAAAIAAHMLMMLTDAAAMNHWRPGGGRQRGCICRTSDSAATARTSGTPRCRASRAVCAETPRGPKATSVRRRHGQLQDLGKSADAMAPWRLRLVSDLGMNDSWPKLVGAARRLGAEFVGALTRLGGRRATAALRVRRTSRAGPPAEQLGGRLRLGVRRTNVLGRRRGARLARRTASMRGTLELPPR